MENLIFILAIALAFADYKIIRWHARLVAFEAESNRWRKFFIVLPLLFGIVAGVFLSGFIYSTSPKTKLVGLPIPAAGWELWDSGWVDFVGPATLPITITNFLFWVMIVHLVAVLVWRSKRTVPPRKPKTPVTA